MSELSSPPSKPCRWVCYLPPKEPGKRRRKVFVRDCRTAWQVWQKLGLRQSQQAHVWPCPDQ